MFLTGPLLFSSGLCGLSPWWAKRNINEHTTTDSVAVISENLTVSMVVTSRMQALPYRSFRIRRNKKFYEEASVTKQWFSWGSSLNHNYKFKMGKKQKIHVK